MVESTDIASDFSGNETVALQIVESNVFSEENMKKNIKARLSLSDGVSKCIGLLTLKAFEQMVSDLISKYASQAHIG